MSVIELQVAGMTCGHCVRAVERAVLARDAAAQVRVDLEAGVVRIEGALTRAAAAEAIAALGYEVRGS